MRLVVFDCPNITWTGVREVLSRNTEHMSSNPTKPGLILLKCFYEYQKTVDEHTRHVLGREVEKANMLEDSWAKSMMAAEEASAAAGGAGGRRGGRRRDNNANGGWDGDRRSSRGSACAIM
jgi:F-box/leucine-rich repeat protein 2/20